MKKSLIVINGIFAALIFGFLAAGVLRAIFRPIDTNDYENRTADQLPAFSAGAVLDGSFQDGCENALSDQTLFAIRAKKLYNGVSAGFQIRAINRFWSDRFVDFNGMTLKDGAMLAKLRDAKTLKSGLDKRIKNLNAAVGKTDVPTYLFYISRDEDVDFQTGETSGCYEYLCSKLHVSRFAGIDRFSAPTLAEYRRDFFRTDHHWNAVGSLRGYRQVLALIAPEQTPLAPLEDEPVRLSRNLTGSYARKVGASGVLTEPFYVYSYDLPAYKVTLGGDDTVYTAYGRQAEYRSENTPSLAITYADYYGYDAGQAVLDNTENDSGDNLLVVGESFDNALLSLLAAHFDTVHAIDLRSYERDVGRAFAYTEYLQAHDITKVLLIGSNDYFSSSVFNLEG